MSEPVRWSRQFLNREALTGFLGDGVADVGVCVDEGRADDGVALDDRFLDGDDFAVLDDDPSLHGFELAAPEDGPLDFHTCVGPVAQLNSSRVAWMPVLTSRMRVPSTSSPSSRMAASPIRSLFPSGA